MRKFILISTIIAMAVLSVTAAWALEDWQKLVMHDEQMIQQQQQHNERMRFFKRVFSPITDPAIQTAVNRLQLENQEDLQRIQSLEKTTVELQNKVKRLESLLKIQNTRNIELEKKVKLLHRAELKRRRQQE